VSAKAASNPEPAPQPEPVDADRWRELDMDQAAAEEAAERGEAEAGAQAQAEAEAETEDDADKSEPEDEAESESDYADDDDDDGDDDAEKKTDQLVDAHLLYELLKRLDTIVFDPRFNEAEEWGWWRHPGVRKIEECGVELYELLGKLQDGLYSLRFDAQNCDLVKSHLAEKAKAKEERKKAEAEAALALAKAKEPELRDRAKKLGLRLTRRDASFYLKAPGGRRAYADTLSEVVATLERHEKMAAAKAKVVAEAA
jgi:hypothetical protein